MTEINPTRDDPNDHNSDYGRGWEAGARAMAERLRREYDSLREVHEARGLFPAALAYTGAVTSVNIAVRDLDDRIRRPIDER